jgi:hypothetical protein
MFCEIISRFYSIQLVIDIRAGIDEHFDNFRIAMFGGIHQYGKTGLDNPGQGKILSIQKVHTAEGCYESELRAPEGHISKS